MSLTIFVHMQPSIRGDEIDINRQRLAQYTTFPHSSYSNSTTSTEMNPLFIELPEKLQKVTLITNPRSLFA